MLFPNQSGGNVTHVVTISLVLVLYNNLINLLPQQLHDRLYVPVNLAFMALVLLWALLGLRLSFAELGFTWPDSVRSALWGIVIGLVIVAPLLILAAFPGLLAGRFSDPRVSELTASQVAYRAAIRIPLGTALFEEVVFRGALFGTLGRLGQWEAVWASSIVFGLWHIVPALDLLKAGNFSNSTVLLVMAILGSVVATFGGGVLFALLRLYTGSVAGPIVAHGLINSLALVAAFIRRGQTGL